MNPKHRRLAVLAVTVSAALVITACSSSTGSSDSASTKNNVVWVMNDNLGDHGFNDSAAAGFTRAQAKGISTKLLQASPTDPQTWDRNLQQVSAQKQYGLIFVTGDGLNDDLTATAPKYPDQKYVDLDNTVNAPNVVSIHYDANEGSFLAGVLAATVSEDKADFPLSGGHKRLAIVAGQQIPVVQDFVVGFKQGVAYVDPSITVAVSYIGNFTDASKAYNLTQTEYANGADVVYNVAGPAGLGILRAAGASNRYAIGVDSNQNSLYPKNILASMLKQIGSSVYDTIMAYQAGTQKFGVTMDYGLKNDGVALILNDSLVPTTVRTKITNATQDVINGKVKVASAVSGS